MNDSRLLLAFVVNGVAEPKGSVSAFVNEATGRAVVVHGGRRTPRKDGSLSDAPKRYRAWCHSVEAAGKVQLLLRRLVATLRDQPLDIDLWVYLPRPRSSSPKRMPYPSVRPDGDKLQRCIWDCLESAGVIDNDARFVDAAVHKRYADDGVPRVEIYIRRPAGLKGPSL